MIPKTLLNPFLPIAGFSLIAIASGNAALISQTVNQTGGTPNWSNSVIWGTPAAVADNMNTYTTATILATGADNGIGLSSKGTLRDSGSTFLGQSVTIIPETELLLKTVGGNTSSANIILNGGAVRYGPNGGGNTATLAGTLNVTSNSILGLGNTNALTVNSTLLGSSTLNLRGAVDATASLLSFGGNLSGFTGILNVGFTGGSITLDFNQDYVLLASLVMGGSTSADVLNLDQAITVNSFQFGAMSAAANTYTAAQLNALYGTGTQFTGAGTLTVVPEPSTVLLGAFGSLFLLRRRRAV